MTLLERILIATDLSARSDRALDRAMMLAQDGGGELTLLHVIEPVAENPHYPPTEPLSVLAGLVRQQLEHDLGDCARKAQIRLEQGHPAEVIERVARELKATLVVVGVARAERLGRFVLGNTAERLVRAVEAPLLIVTDRPRAHYQRVAVAVDFSPVSAQTVELATSVFPGQRITAIHAYPALPYGSYDTELDQAMVQWRQAARNEYDTWLAGLNLSPEARGRLVARLEHGEPARVIREAARNGGFDLVVIGTKGRGRVFEFLIGSVAKDILAELPCDALFVREAK